jgi:putative Mg2+ transporter-C (MgtC) family protein
MLSPALVEALRLDLLGKLGLAVLLGGIVGLERELSGKPAGLRTNILICLGSTLLMDVSHRVGIVDGVRAGDPGRIAAQVVSGIGFLGAGTILQARGVVVGLTTAATIWVVAAIGLSVGAGFYVEASGAALLVTLVLAGLAPMERWIQAKRRTVTGTIRVRRDMSYEEIRDTLNSYGIVVQSKTVFEHPDDRTIEVKMQGPAKQFDTVAHELERKTGVHSVQIE